MYLLDTNVWLERLLNQERSEEVEQLLEQTSSDLLFITDFALHSIGVVLTRLKRTEVLSQFVQDLLIDGDVFFIHLEPEDTSRLIQVADEFNLDFDDAYQYVAAEKYNLTMVSFDSDFDRTRQGRRSPVELLQS